MKFLGMAKILQALKCVSFATNLDSDDLATCAAKKVVPLYSVARYQLEYVISFTLSVEKQIWCKHQPP